MRSVLAVTVLFARAAFAQVDLPLEFGGGQPGHELGHFPFSVPYLAQKMDQPPVWCLGALGEDSTLEFQLRTCRTEGLNPFNQSVSCTSWATHTGPSRGDFSSVFHPGRFVSYSIEFNATTTEDAPRMLGAAVAADDSLLSLQCGGATATPAAETTNAATAAATANHHAGTPALVVSRKRVSISRSVPSQVGGAVTFRGPGLANSWLDADNSVTVLAPFSGETGYYAVCISTIGASVNLTRTVCSNLDPHQPPKCVPTGTVALNGVTPAVLRGNNDAAAISVTERFQSIGASGKPDTGAPFSLLYYIETTDGPDSPVSDDFRSFCQTSGNGV